MLVLRWPAQSGELAGLIARGVPRLLLVAGGAQPPDTADCLQDWVRMPATDPEVEARLEGLKARAAAHRLPPRLDEDGRLFYKDDWVALSPVEHRLLSLLMEHFGTVVPDEEVLSQVWGPQRPTSNAYRVHITRLRQRIRPLGLEIRAVRLRGYVLQELSAKELHRPRTDQT